MIFLSDCYVRVRFPSPNHLHVFMVGYLFFFTFYRFFDEIILHHEHPFVTDKCNLMLGSVRFGNREWVETYSKTYAQSQAVKYLAFICTYAIPLSMNIILTKGNLICKNSRL